MTSCTLPSRSSASCASSSLPKVRADFPLQSVRVAWKGELTPPDDLPGVLHRELHEGTWRLVLREGAEPQALLPRLQDVGPLTLFSAYRPSGHTPTKLRGWARPSIAPWAWACTRISLRQLPP